MKLLKKLKITNVVFNVYLVLNNVHIMHCSLSVNSFTIRDSIDFESYFIFFVTEVFGDY